MDSVVFMFFGLVAGRSGCTSGGGMVVIDSFGLWGSHSRGGAGWGKLTSTDSAIEVVLTVVKCCAYPYVPT